MKIDKFEDSIRKKLNQINPEYQETDWDNFKAFSGAYKTPFFKTLIGKVLALSAIAIAVSFTLFFSISQYNENKALSLKNIELNKVNELLKLKQNEYGKTVNKINHNLLENSKLDNNDTRNIDNSIMIKEENRGIKSNEITSISPNIINSTKVEVSSKKQIHFENNIHDKVKDISPSSETVKNYSKERNIISNKAKFSEFAKYDEKAKKLPYSIYSNDNYLEINKKNTVIEKNNNVSENTSKTVIEYKLLSNKGIVIDSTKKLQKHFSSKDFAYYMPNEALDKPSKKGFSLKDAYLRFGAAAEIGKDYKSKSFVGELFLDQRISISSGIKVTNIEGDRFQSETEFKVKRRRDFKDLYQTKNTPEAHAIANMQERSRLLQIPISINYHHPLNNNFWLLAGIGTDLDIKVSSQSDYSFKLLKPFGPVIQYGQYEERQKAQANEVSRKTFNNFNLKLGAEKRFGKLTAQITAFNTTQFKKVEYRKNYTTFGGGLKLFYSL